MADLTAPAFRAEHQTLSHEYDNMLACIRCGLCLTSCPTYVLSLEEAEGPRGRVGMARALTEGHLQLTPDLVQHELNCLVCDACSAVCPAGVHMDPLQVMVRSAIHLERRRPLWQRLAWRFVFGWLFMDLGRLRLLARLLWLYQRSGLRWLARRSGVLRLLGLAAAERLLPNVPATALVPRGETYPALPALDGGGEAIEGADVTEVAFFAGCIMSTGLADLDRATLRVLQCAGCAVTNPRDQGCCGALHAHAGDLVGFRTLARRTMAAFEPSRGPIVVNSAGCGAMLKDYGHHFRDDAEWSARARAFSARVRDLSEVLVDRRLPLDGRQPAQVSEKSQPSQPSERSQPGARTERSSQPARVVYQDACHLLHAQRISRQPRTLLGRVPGLELVEIAEAGLCCGSAGVYNVTNPAQSRQLQQRKLDNALVVAPEVIVTANPGCLLQLRAGLVERGSDVAVKHLAEVLDEATGGGCA